MEVSQAKKSKDRSAMLPPLSKSSSANRPLATTKLPSKLKDKKQSSSSATSAASASSGYGKQDVAKQDSKKANQSSKQRRGSFSKRPPGPEKGDDGLTVSTAEATERAQQYKRRKEQMKRLKRREKQQKEQKSLQPSSAEKLNETPAELPSTKRDEVVTEGQENSFDDGEEKEDEENDEAMDGRMITATAIEEYMEKYDAARNTPSPQRDWKLSQPLGGRFSDIRPLFSQDEKHVLIAQWSSIKIYSLKTSQLVRTLSFSKPPTSKYLNPQFGPTTKTSNGHVVLGFAYHPKDNNKLYGLTANGELWLWNWNEGIVEGWWRTKLSSSLENGSGGIFITEDIGKQCLWTYERTRFSERKHLHLLRKLDIPEPAPFNSRTAPVEPSTVHALNKAPRCLRVIDSKTFALICANHIVIGHEHALPQDDSWGVVREIPTESELTCMDVLVTSSSSASSGKKKNRKNKKKANAEKDGNIVVGDSAGVIYVYNNVLRRTENENDKMTIRRLHWHREAVGSVQWSLDGTYILSGGKETVLVIWQVATSRQQFLPHLSGAVEDIIVSPQGRHYGVRLGDNSVMVLSTSELKPLTNISGIQSRVFSKVSNVKEVVESTNWRVPCAVNPIKPSEILLAVPTSQLEDASSPYLQTFDTLTNRSIHRQALTRTLATQKNVAPDGTRLKEPTVKQMAISADGMWLATVDEWAASAQDFVDSGAPPVAAKDRAKEVFLRFWRWNEAAKQWELVTRMDDPHPSTMDSKPGTVYDLVASPRGHGFVSVGQDGNVKFWKPRARTRAGVKSADPSMVVWGCRNVTEIIRQDGESPQNNRLAFSADGSVLAVSSSSSEDDEGIVWLVDPSSGAIRHSINSLKTSTIFGLALIDRFLVIAGSERLLVWNLVTAKAQWACELTALVFDDVKLDRGGFVPNIQLAADQVSNTFALSINYPSPVRSGHNAAANTVSQVTVFNPEYYNPLITKTVYNGVVALKSISVGATPGVNVSSDVSQGYMWVDGSARIYFLGPRSAATSSAGIPAVISEEPFSAGGLSNSYKAPDDAARAAVVEAPSDDDEMDDEDDAWDGVPRILRSDALAKLFPAPAYASPALEDVFEKFMGLVGQKPKDFSSVEEGICEELSTAGNAKNNLPSTGGTISIDADVSRLDDELSDSSASEDEAN